VTLSESIQEAEDTNRRLCGLIEQLLESQPSVAQRMQDLDSEDSVLSSSATHEDGTSAISANESRGPNVYLSSESFTFDRDLQTSRVYSRTILNRQSLSSQTSTALYTTALSLFSKLSLSEVSDLSFFALPVYAVDLENSDCYVFGEEGVWTIEALPATPSQPFASNGSSLGIGREMQQSQNRLATIDLRFQSTRPRRLLGRFAQLPTPNRMRAADGSIRHDLISIPSFVSTTNHKVYDSSIMVQVGPHMNLHPDLDDSDEA
jgi:hypothetical protein